MQALMRTKCYPQYVVRVHLCVRLCLLAMSHVHCTVCAPVCNTQDPSYPVYVDTSVMMGMTGQHNGTGFDNIEYMVCRPENDFFPDLSKVRV